MPPTDVDEVLQQGRAEIDFADIRGQEAVKRAATIAVEIYIYSQRGSDANEEGVIREP